MCFFVFNIEYDLLVRHFWEFMQGHYFGIEEKSIQYTAKMIELQTRLAATNILANSEEPEPEQVYDDEKEN